MKIQPIVDMTGFQVTKGVPPSEFCKQFVQGMLDRMSMSFFKYGAVSLAYPGKVHAIASLLTRLRNYMGERLFAEALRISIETPLKPELKGNTEMLMDVSNFAMIEFMYPRHPDAFFTPTDSNLSPGRSSSLGNIDQLANTTGQENVRKGGSNLVTRGGFYKQEGD